MIDSQHRITTPEGISLPLSMAGLMPRALACAIDFIIRGAVYMFAAWALGFFGGIAWGVILILYFVLDWLYPILFECLWHGATPGKRVMKLRVVHDDGTPVGWTASLVRNTLRFIDLLPLLYCIGGFCVLMTQKFKRLGDLAAGTVVIHTKAPQPLQALAEGDAVMPPYALSAAERRTVIDFALRAARLSQARAEEIAQAAPTLTGQAQGEDAVHTLQNYARYLSRQAAKSASPAPKNDL